jgi:hypothetical protein
MTFRFSIRDVLWAVLAVALVASWHLERRLFEKRLEAMQEERDKASADAKSVKLKAEHFETAWRDAMSALIRSPTPDEDQKGDQANLLPIAEHD